MEKMSNEEEAQFWAEINAQAIQDHLMDKIKLKLHQEGKCNPPTCCEIRWMVYAKKLYPNFRVENNLIFFE